MIFLLPLLNSLTIASSAPLSCTSSVTTNKTICTDNQINIDHFSNSIYKKNYVISGKQKIYLDNILIKLNQQLDVFKRENNINKLNKKNLIKFNDWLESEDKAKNNYSKGQNSFEPYWWGFKIWVTWDKLKEFMSSIHPSQPLTSTGIFTALKMFFPRIGVPAVVITTIIAIGAIEVAGCLLGRQIWNKKGVVMRFLWVPIMTSCWDQ